MASLDIFEHRFGDEAKPATALSASGDNTLGQVGLRMLDAVQTVVDVLADEQNKGYRVGFAATTSAYTEHGEKRIVISGLPLFDAQPGTPYRDIAAVLTGFAVHEVGHTKRIGIIDAVKKEWPNKVLPRTLGNIVEDIVLEARTVERYAGMRDVFAPTFDWVADKTCPKTPLSWGGTTGHKVNVAGQMLRYRDYVTFTPDEVTQSQLRWWDEWGARITAKLTPAQAVALIHEALDHIHEPIEDDEPEGSTEGDDGEPEDGDGEPGEGEGNGKGKGPETESLPDEEDDDDDTEGGDGDGDSDGEDGTEGGGSETDAEPIDGTDDGEGEGSGTEGDGEDGEDAHPDDTEGEGEGHGQGLDADTTNRTKGDKGSNDGPGGGGTGQAIAEAGDEDPDAGLDETELDKSFDDTVNEGQGYQNAVLDRAIEEERVTERLTAGIHGNMRVIFR